MTKLIDVGEKSLVFVQNAAGDRIISDPEAQY